MCMYMYIQKYEGLQQFTHHLLIAYGIFITIKYLCEVTTLIVDGGQHTLLTYVRVSNVAIGQYCISAITF